MIKKEEIEKFAFAYTKDADDLKSISEYPEILFLSVATYEQIKKWNEMF